MGHEGALRAWNAIETGDTTKNTMAMAMIITHLSPDFMVMAREHTTAKELWEALKDRCANDRRRRK